MTGHIVGVIGQQDQVVLLQCHAFDHLLEKPLCHIFIPQLAFPQLHHQLVLFSLHHLLIGKGHIQKVLPQRAGQGPLEKSQHFFLFFLAQSGQGLIKLGENLPPVVDIAASDMGNAVFILAKPAAQLRHFLFCHSSSFLGHGM